MGRGTVSFSYFRRALIAMNPRIQLEVDEKSKHRGVMVYLKMPQHPESNPVNGLWEILAVPSPKYFRIMPKHDTEHDGKWVRGWSTFFRACRKMKEPSGRLIFDPKRVRAFFKEPYNDKFKSVEYRNALNAKNEAPESKLAKQMQDKRYVFDPRKLPSHMAV